MLIKNARVFLPDGTFQKTDVRFGARIMETGPLPGEGVDAEGLYLIPGLIDLHTHGAMGEDVSDGSEKALTKMAAFCADNGVTSFLPTTMTLDEETLLSAMRTIRGYKNEHGARMIGVRLEGPFLSAKRKGAQAAEFLHAPDIALLRRLQEASGSLVRIVDIAPELPGAMEFIKEASSLCRVSLAHSAADYDTAAEAFHNGATEVTHLFNAMEPFLHRAPGIVGAAADADAYVEVIADGIHLHPAMVRAVFKLFDRVCLISDSMRGAGLPDGDYSLGGQAVTVKAGKCTLSDGTIAGSGIHLMTGLRRSAEFRIPLERAVAAATVIPARAVNMEKEIGVIAPGARADLVLLDSSLGIRAVYVGGTEWKTQEK
ncbi:MAG TPA: N-acetylglucosamine-6-phosphate deacetylase [Feifaniaceae bacterium]|nr:N-acetylglucosamine-6-phosphate deacetylase [Feifaniaceae bacterium]